MATISDQQQAATARAEQLLAQGNAQAAAQAVEPVLRAFPGFARAQLVAARAFRDLGQTELALARYKVAADTSKDFGLWREFVIELLRAGQKSRARAAAKKAPVRGEQKKALLDLAKTGLQQSGAATGGVSQATLRAMQETIRRGEFNKAAEEARDLLARHPASAFLHNILGIVALKDKHYPEAETHFRDTLRLSPNFTGAHGNLGLVLTLQDKLDEAISVLRQAVLNDAQSIEARTNLAAAHLKAGEFDNAITHAKKALELAPADIEILQVLCSALHQSERHAEALPHLEHLRVLAPDEPEVLNQILDGLEGSGRNDEAVAFARQHLDSSPELTRRYARLLSQLGEIDEAADLLRQVIDQNPEDPNAYSNYGALRKWKPEDPVLKKLEHFVANSDNARLKGLGLYALTKARMDLGQHDAAMELLHQANAAHAKASRRSFAPDLFQKEIDDIIGRWDEDCLARFDGVGAVSVAPVFIVGMPRSGSTLLDQILHAHPTLVSVGEDSVVSPFFPVDIEADENVLKQAAREGGAALRRAGTNGRQVVDKYLHNFLRLGALATAFPRARFLNTSRDPRSVALSIYSNALKVNGHPYSTDLEHIAEFYTGYERLMAHWRGCVGDRIRDVSYEKLVADPEPNIRAVIDWLGLPWDEACLKPNSVARRIKTLSFAQVRSDIVTTSSERWRQFETGLTPFTKKLQKAGIL